MPTTVRPVPFPSAPAPSLSVEAILAAAMAAMRDLAAAGKDDDYYVAHARNLLDRRPLVVVGIVGANHSFAWAMEPGDQEGADGGIAAHVLHYPPDVQRQGVTSSADLVRKDFVLSEIERLASWLWRNETGEMLAEEAERANR